MTEEHLMFILSMLPIIAVAICFWRFTRPKPYVVRYTQRFVSPKEGEPSVLPFNWEVEIKPYDEEE